MKRVKDAVGTHHVTVTGKVLEAPSPAQAVVEEAHKGGGLQPHRHGQPWVGGGFGSLALGSVSTQVLHGALPVLIVKAE